MALGLSARNRRRLFIVLVLLLAVLGAADADGQLDSAKRGLAGLFWPDDAAPWEKVTAVYYPDPQKPLEIRISDARFADLAACRDHITQQAAENGDADLQKGRYQCAVGFYPGNGQGGAGGNYRLLTR